MLDRKGELNLLRENVNQVVAISPNQNLTGKERYNSLINIDFNYQLTRILAYSPKIKNFTILQLNLNYFLELPDQISKNAYIQLLKMSRKKGKTFIHQIWKFLEFSQAPHLTAQSPTIESRKEEEENSLQGRKMIILRKKQTNFIKRVCKLTRTLSFDHIDKFFGFISLNQKSIESPGFEQSYFYTYMHGRQIEKVQIFEKAVIFEMTEPQFSAYQPPIEYLLEKYRSKNNFQFYKFASVLEQISKLIKEMGPPQCPEPLMMKKNLDLMGDKMYVGLFGPQKLVISKSLLTFLEYDIEQLAIQTVKYRCLQLQLCSSLKYSVVMTQFVKGLQHSLQLSLGKITLEEYQQLTTFIYSDYIYSKSHIECFCDLRLYYLNPNFLIQQIDSIHYRRGEISQKMLPNSQMAQVIQAEREKIRQSEYKTIKNLKHIPRDLFAQNKDRIAGWLQKQNEVISSQAKQRDRDNFLERV